MAYEQKPNNGTLFTNKSKSKPTSPDYSGDLLIDVRSLNVKDGVAKVRIAGWKKEGPSGTFLSLAISNPQEKGQMTPRKEQEDDENPF